MRPPEAAEHALAGAAEVVAVLDGLPESLAVADWAARAAARSRARLLAALVMPARWPLDLSLLTLAPMDAADLQTRWEYAASAGAELEALTAPLAVDWELREVLPADRTRPGALLAGAAAPVVVLPHRSDRALLRARRRLGVPVLGVHPDLGCVAVHAGPVGAGRTPPFQRRAPFSPVQRTTRRRPPG
ncbi:hypothetical protein O4J56_20320 [Nocardiopsis sp. RSe5-2]|uniref:Universal stress protein n=1 Tax=Nocardiopsis endophytica TaxID=3018445 RepID=A0ABT4U7Q8_9ACTN|nr:hypothetical protein [Nocardiopsis endophytica]MDA2813002.1 hypothetical protein [Nocardiopsis endophytica]